MFAQIPPMTPAIVLLDHRCNNKRVITVDVHLLHPTTSQSLTAPGVMCLIETVGPDILLNGETAREGRGNTKEQEG